MATKKYVWKFDLEEHLMTKDVLEDYKAILKPIQSLDITDVARAIVEERTGNRESSGSRFGKTPGSDRYRRYRCCRAPRR